MSARGTWMLAAAAAVVIVGGSVAIATHQGEGGGTATETQSPAPSATVSQGTAEPSPPPSPAPTSHPNVAGPIPILTEAPMDDHGEDPGALAPVTASAESDAEALRVAQLYYDTLVDTTIDARDWRRALEPITTEDQYRTGIRKIDATWYDGLGKRTAPVTLEHTDGTGLIYAHITTEFDDDIAVVLVRPTATDSWLVDGFRG